MQLLNFNLQTENTFRYLAKMNSLVNELKDYLKDKIQIHERLKELGVNQDDYLVSFRVAEIQSIQEEINKLENNNMKTYTVQLVRTSYQFTDVEVIANSAQEAADYALDNAGDYDYSEKDCEYSIGFVTAENN